MPLTDAACRAAKPREKQYKLSDAGGLYLLVKPKPSGARLWRISYRFGGKQPGLSLGSYPAVSLAAARAERDRLKSQLAQGIDPAAQRKADKAAATGARENTFRILAEERLALFEKDGDAARTLKKKRTLVDGLNLSIGDRPIAEIREDELLKALNVRFVDRGYFLSANLARALASNVFKLAILTNRAERDPAANLGGVLPTAKAVHRSAVTDPKAIGALLRAIDGSDGQASIRIALQLLALTFVRPGELRAAEWSEFDIAGQVWSIPAHKMKMKLPHKVPLARQAVTLLEDLREITGTSQFLFPSTRSWHRPMSDGTMNAMLRRLGYTKDEQVPHGFRTIASTSLNGAYLFNRDAIERQLAHGEKDDVRAAYDRAEHWPERVRMMQWWADHLDDLRGAGNVVSLAAARA